MGLSEVSIKLARASGSETVKVSTDKKKIRSEKKDDIRAVIAKSLEKVHSRRSEYLQALKEKIQRGEYQVSAEEVAKAVVGVIDDAP